jgi:hypothetical protein
MEHPRQGWVWATVASLLLPLSLGCGPTLSVRESRKTPVDEGAGSLEATRRSLQGSWTLVSLEVVDAKGARRPVKANGTLTYDAFGTMSVRGVIEDQAMKDTIVLDFDGRIVIDTVRREFRAADITLDRPVDQDRIAPISPDKVRRYELSGDSFVVTYLDAKSNPTAIASWRRSA